MNWDKYFLGIAKAVSKKSHCLSVKRGCIIVRDRQILSAGYNGPPRGYPNCDDIYSECPRKTLNFKSGEGLYICPSAHAEANAIVQAARNGASVNGSTLYCNFKQKPCRECSKIIINSGIIKIVTMGNPVKYDENGLTGEDILNTCEINVVNGELNV